MLYLNDSQTEAKAIEAISHGSAYTFQYIETKVNIIYPCMLIALRFAEHGETQPRGFIAINRELSFSEVTT